ncbi:MAG: Fe-S cluster assembly protein SufD [Gammaproteobacteria bacterium]|nr:Fe-S cluster assembly protein SufD [Gammaproteobacteria bacterium]
MIKAATVLPQPSLLAPLPLKDVPLWMNQKRDAHWQAFLQHGLPTRQDERWKYVDLNIREALQLASAKSIHPAIQKSDAVLDDSINVSFVNGYFQPLPAPDSIIVCSIREALQNHEILIKPYLEKTLDAKDAKRFPLANLNAASFEDGLFLYIPANCKVALPIQLLSSVCLAETKIALHHLIVVDKNAHLEFLETYHSSIESLTVQNNATHIYLEEGSTINYYKLQHENAAAIHIAYTYIHQSKASMCSYYNFTNGAHFSRDDVVIDLQGEGALAKAFGFYQLHHPDQYVDQHLEILHHASHTQSSMFYKGVLYAQNRGVFNGRLLIAKDIKKIKAEQTNHNLLLNNRAEMNSKPELEIYADDVQCNHGATIGELDEAAIFYLRARGLSKDAAIHTLLKGFSEEVFNTIENILVKTYLKKWCQNENDSSEA